MRNWVCVYCLCLFCQVEDTPRVQTMKLVSCNFQKYLSWNHFDRCALWKTPRIDKSGSSSNTSERCAQQVSSFERDLQHNVIGNNVLFSIMKCGFTVYKWAENWECSSSTEHLHRVSARLRRRLWRMNDDSTYLTFFVSFFALLLVFACCWLALSSPSIGDSKQKDCSTMFKWSWIIEIKIAVAQEIQCFQLMIFFLSPI